MVLMAASSTSSSVGDGSTSTIFLSRRSMRLCSAKSITSAPPSPYRTVVERDQETVPLSSSSTSNNRSSAKSCTCDPPSVVAPSRPSALLLHVYRLLSPCARATYPHRDGLAEAVLR